MSVFVPGNARSAQVVGETYKYDIQVLRQMANDLRKETEACLQAKPAGRKGAKGLQKMLQQPEGCKEAVADAEICTGMYRRVCL